MKIYGPYLCIHLDIYVYVHLAWYAYIIIIIKFYYAGLLQNQPYVYYDSYI